MIYFDVSSREINTLYDIDGRRLAEEPIAPAFTTLPYTTNYIITADWLANARKARDAMIADLKLSDDAIPLFIETDSHGNTLDGNKACHNLAKDSEVGYIWNIHLGDFESYYYAGKNPADMIAQKNGIKRFISVMGNHEFLANNADDAPLAEMEPLIAAYTPDNAIVGDATMGAYKIVDEEKHIKFIITQFYIPDVDTSKKHITRRNTAQIDWLLTELSANDGLDIIILQHEPLVSGTIDRDGGAHTGGDAITLGDIVSDRRAKRSGTFVDDEGVSHDYNFSDCTSDFLCSLHGHSHAERLRTDSFPMYVADWFGSNHGHSCLYGLIDRAHQKLYIYKFGTTYASERLDVNLG